MSVNAMREGLAKHPCCGAYCRTTGQPCKSPAMKNGRCRMHGGKNPGAPRGEGNANYRHGRRTKDAIEERQRWQEVIRALKKVVAGCS